MSVYIQIANTLGTDESVTAWSRIYHFLGFADFGNTHLVLRIGRKTFQWVTVLK